jgi:hypothetical protein
MSVGLLNFFVNSIQESYLTLNPEITFFNVVYKAYSVFAVESVAVPPTNSRPVDNTSHNGFNTVFSYEIPRAGDLISKIYVSIKLPKIQLKKYLPKINKEFNQQNVKNIFNSVSKVYAMVYTMVKTFYDSSNNHDVNKVINNILNYVNGNTHLEVLYAMIEHDIKKDKYTCIHKLDTFKINKVFSDPSLKTKNQLLRVGNQLLEIFTQVKQYYNKTIINKNKSNSKYLHAWVKYLGYAIINSVTIYIGGQKIDEHTGLWLNVWHQLTRDLSTEDIFNKMIGNIECLTNFNDKNKPSYTLQIPLEFWFCRHYASSLPLSSLQYQTVRIELATNSFKNLFKTIINKNYCDADNNNNDCNGDNDCNKDNDFDDDNNNQLCSSIYPVLLIDYIYLGKQERMEFACKPQEYIIDQVQIYTQPAKLFKDLAINLDYFVNPIREFIWTLEKDWNNYEEIDNATLLLYDSALVENLNGNYFNYVQPYQHHRTTPGAGIYNYSFSLYPEELQVSGSANFSVIMGSRLLIHRKDCCDLDSDCIYLNIFGRAINVLRFIGGFGGLAFTYG